ncbi:cation-transporting P-type ATPase [Planotetraspora sp. A-T 1434]|uniref:cation-translocating P-type ATPase n=1 Tax=Planotetraspora sp. A-T 1434 TaxID=2979219 RepID=UPI0021BFE7CA|nr:cation-transporting P-type ATPase [Planotetraspora sp. A-T 1434]MCT9933733.1 cation-transporting P-type ATPase [Planotetraspora sp. A-T 1434]
MPADRHRTAQVTAAGLPREEAARRLAEYGPNTIGKRPRPPLWRRVLDQMRDPLILVLLAAAVLTLVTGDHPDAVAILLVITANTAIGLVQEVRAEQTIAALADLSAPVARVIRDGQERQVASAEVVPGDLVLLGEGDVVPADGDVVEAAGLLVDESALTGESVPVDKAPGDSPEHGAVASGTVVVRGRGRVMVTATGTASTIGRLASLMDTGFGLTPLQCRLAGLGRVLAAVTVALCAVVLTLGLLRGQSPELMIVAAISLAVAAVPESLPAVVTLGLALGARRMAGRQAVIRRLPAVETLGSVTVIATDKTGTLTEGRMVAEKLWTPHGEATITGIGYAPQGHIVRAGSPITAGDAPDLAALLRAGVLCNDATLRPPVGDGTSWQAMGDPTEAALLTAGAKLGLDRPALERELPRVAEIPFDSSRKRMTTVHRLPGGGVRVVCKGAPELVLRPPILDEDAQVLARAVAWAEKSAGAGYRVLAIAATDRPTQPHCPDDWEKGLSLLGLVAILDPPRSQAHATITAIRAAGITPVVITGDHPLTAQAIAERLGITTTDQQVTTGDRIRQGTAGPLTDIRICARTTPEQKVDIIEAWRQAGHVVAMTGDGVNDGPALRRADIGVAMGRRGTEVARQAADMVLADDDLATLVAAVDEGRRIYANIRRFLLYGLAGGTAEILVMLLGPFLGMPLPLLPSQILWINLLTHGVPGVALGAEPGEPNAMRCPPRPPGEKVLGAGLWRRIVFMGSFIALITLVAGVWARDTGHPWQSLVFLVLGATQFGVALGSRARPGSLANPFLLAAVGAAVLLQIAGVYLPPLQALLGTQPLPPSCLAIASAMAALSYVVMRLQTQLGRTKQHHEPLRVRGKP